MGNRWLATLALLGCSLVGLPAQAAETLTLEEALTAALTDNPSLVTATIGVDRAEASILSAQASWDPVFTAGGNVSTSDSTNVFVGRAVDQQSLDTSATSGIRGDLPTGTGYRVNGRYSYSDQTASGFGGAGESQTIQQRPGLEVGVSQEVLRGHRTAFNRRQVLTAKSGLTVAEVQLDAARQSALRDVATTYWSWAYQEEAVEIARSRVDVAAEALRVGRLQLEEGRVAPVDVSRLQTEFVRARQALTTAQQQASDSRDQLLTQLGRDPGAELTPGSDLAVATPDPVDVDQVIALTKAGNRDLAVLRQQTEQAILDTKLARHALLPSLTLDASVNLSQVTSKDEEGTIEAPNQTLTGSANFSVPLGNRAARGELARTAASEAELRANMEAREREVAASAARQARVFNDAVLQIELADQEVQLAEQTLAAEEARSAAGRNVQRDVLEARTALFDARLQAAKARSDRQLAWIELLLLQGELTVDAAVGR